MRLLPSTILALAVISGLVERRILVSSIHCPRDTAGLFSPDSAVPTALAREVVHDKLGRCKNWDAANGSCVTFNNAAGDLAEYHHQPPVITQASTNPHHLRSNAAMSSHPSFATVTKPLGPNKVTDTSIYIKTFSPMPSPPNPPEVPFSFTQHPQPTDQIKAPESGCYYTYDCWRHLCKFAQQDEDNETYYNREFSDWDRQKAKCCLVEHVQTCPEGASMPEGDYPMPHCPRPTENASSIYKTMSWIADDIPKPSGMAA